MLGNTSAFAVVGVTSGSGCPAGDFAVGANIWVEGRGYTTGIQLLCRDSLGNSVPAGVAGPALGGVSGSMCSGSDVAVGLYGRAGNVMDAIGIRCASSGGTYDAALVGGGGGGPVGPADCPAANALTSVTVWAGDYFGAPDQFGIQGLCDSTDNDLAIAAGVSPAPVDATNPFGAKVWFTVPTATDEDGPVSVTCDHVPGSMFGLGQTTVTCTATDNDDSPPTVSTTLTVNVLPIAPPHP